MKWPFGKKEECVPDSQWVDSREEWNKIREKALELVENGRFIECRAYLEGLYMSFPSNSRVSDYLSGFAHAVEAMVKHEDSSASPEFTGPVMTSADGVCLWVEAERKRQDRKWGPEHDLSLIHI